MRQVKADRLEEKRKFEERFNNYPPLNDIKTHINAHAQLMIDAPEHARQTRVEFKFIQETVLDTFTQYKNKGASRECDQC